MNLRIVLMIFVCFSVGFGSLYFVNDWVLSATDLQKWWYIEQKDISTKKIFLIGNSHTAKLMPLVIQDFLQQNNFEYNVYNLAFAGNVPEKVIIYVDEIVEAKPKLIVYGIDFHSFASNDREFNIGPVNQVENEINIQNKLQESFSDLVINTNIIDLKNLKNPKLNSLKIISGEVKLGDSPEMKSPNQPFVKLCCAKLMNITELEQHTKEEPFTKYGRHVDYNDDGFLSLKKMLKTFNENEIRFLLFVPPYHEFYLNTIPEKEKELFFLMVEELENEFNVEVYDFHDKYSDKEIWSNPDHIAPIATGGEIYSEDIAEIILGFLKNNVI